MQFFIPVQMQPNSRNSFESEWMLFVQLDFFCLDFHTDLYNIYTLRARNLKF